MAIFKPFNDHQIIADTREIISCSLELLRSSAPALSLRPCSSNRADADRDADLLERADRAIAEIQRLRLGSDRIARERGPATD
jgi:hypothetical protein